MKNPAPPFNLQNPFLLSYIIIFYFSGEGEMALGSVGEGENFVPPSIFPYFFLLQLVKLSLSYYYYYFIISGERGREICINLFSIEKIYK